MFVEAPTLAALPGIRHAFFTREGGVSEGLYASLNGGVGSSDAPDNVRENRRRMTEHLGVAPDALASLYQVHSPEVVTVEQAWAQGERPKADGMVTNRPGLALGIATADCGPVLFADAEARVIGGAHAGWKGAFTACSKRRSRPWSGLAPGASGSSRCSDP
jgi:copper oxidase (laccase) domain-containing protein